MSISQDYLDIPLMRNNITAEDRNALIKFIQESDRFTNGPKVREFEMAWSHWLGVRHSVFVNSGSSANFISMAVLRDLFGPGEVIVPPVTWSSDIAAVITAGLTPVFADINLHNLAMAEDEILRKVNKNTRAVFLTHVLGFNGLSKTLLAELQKRRVSLIEDVCESHGASMDGIKCGSFGLASNFSFYYAHHMSTIEGGMICTNDELFYEYCRLYRSHGLARELSNQEIAPRIGEITQELNHDFTFLAPGYNMRSSDLNAVIGLTQLKRLDENNARRVENFKLFLANLDSDKYFTDFDLNGAVNYAFVVILKNGGLETLNDLVELLKRKGVEARRGTVGGNMARQPFVRKAMPEFDPASLKNAELIHFQGLYTGNYPDLEKEKIMGLCNLLNCFEVTNHE